MTTISVSPELSSELNDLLSRAVQQGREEREVELRGFLAGIAGQLERMASELRTLRSWIPRDVLFGDEMPIEDLNLSVRTYNCLKREGIHYVGQLAALSTEDMLDIRNFGQKCTDEVIATLDALVEKANKPKVKLAEVNKPLLEQDDDSVEPVNVAIRPTPIQELSLSGATLKYLLRSGSHTIEELEQLNDLQLLSIPRIADGRIKEIRQAITRFRYQQKRK